jgi:hypothetical protein
VDAVAGEERERAFEEADRCRRFLVWEDFGVGEAAVVVDRDVDELPADSQMASAANAGDPLVVAVADAGDPFAGAALIRPSFLMSIWTSSPGRERS